LGEEVGGAALALEDIDLGEVIRNLELGEREPHLVAVAGPPHRIERKHPEPAARWVSCEAPGSSVLHSATKRGGCKASTGCTAKECAHVAAREGAGRIASD